LEQVGWPQHETTHQVAARQQAHFIDAILVSEPALRLCSDVHKFIEIANSISERRNCMTVIRVSTLMVASSSVTSKVS
jgi:hypothetical protein